MDTNEAIKILERQRKSELQTAINLGNVKDIYALTALQTKILADIKYHLCVGNLCSNPNMVMKFIDNQYGEQDIDK